MPLDSPRTACPCLLHSWLTRSLPAHPRHCKVAAFRCSPLRSLFHGDGMGRFRRLSSHEGGLGRPSVEGECHTGKWIGVVSRSARARRLHATAHAPSDRARPATALCRFYLSVVHSEQSRRHTSP